MATKELGKLVEACLFLGVASNRLAATIQMPCGKGNENCEFIALIATQPFWAILSQHLKFNMDFGSLLEKTMQEVGKKSRWILFHQPRLAWSTGKGISHTHTCTYKYWGEVVRRRYILARLGNVCLLSTCFTWPWTYRLLFCWDGFERSQLVQWFEQSENDATHTHTWNSSGNTYTMKTYTVKLRTNEHYTDTNARYYWTYTHLALQI